MPVAEENIESYMGPTADTAPPQSGVTPAPPSDVKPQITTGGAKSGRPKAAIIVGIVLVVILAAAAGFAYMKLMNKTEDHTGHMTETTAAPAEVTAADVDTTTSAIDESLAKFDDTKDFTEAELSDTTLGL
jgi:hypothetical protein